MNKSIKLLLCSLVALIPATSMAQALKSCGKSVSELIPENWECISTKGDLNKDGITDIVIIATPDNKENTTVRYDGYVYNFNQPVMAIYWGKKDGSFALFKQYNQVIPARPSEYTSIDASLEVTKTNVLKISLEQFSSAGSWENNTATYLFRYQNGDFMLIGKDLDTHMRNTGNTTTTSENYLTNKRCVTKGHVNSSKTTTKWSKINKQPLKHLGFPLDL